MLDNMIMLASVTEPPKGVMDALIAMFTTVFTFLGNCFSFILDQPILLFIFAIGLIPAGFAIFGSAKNSVAH